MDPVVGGAVGFLPATSLERQARLISVSPRGNSTHWIPMEASACFGCLVVSWFTKECHLVVKYEHRVTDSDG